MDYIEDYFTLNGLDLKYLSDYKYLARPYSIVPSRYNSMSCENIASEIYFEFNGGVEALVKLTDLFIFYCYLRDKNRSVEILRSMNVETDVLNRMYDALFYRACVRTCGGISDWADSFTSRADFKAIACLSPDVLLQFDKSLLITYETLQEIFELL